MLFILLLLLEDIAAAYLSISMTKSFTELNEYCEAEK